MAGDTAVRAELERRGLDADRFMAHAAASQDAETRRYQQVAELRIPVLHAAGWRCRIAGADGLGCWDHPRRNQRLIHSIARAGDGHVWAHVSLSRRDRAMPTWEQTRDAWWLVYDELPGIIVVAPPSEHVNIAEANHVWGCLTKRLIPDFAAGLGSI